jgi:hypothetical protein
LRSGPGHLLPCGSALKVFALILEILAWDAFRNLLRTLESLGRIQEDAILTTVESGTALWTLAGEFDLAETVGKLDSAHGTPSDLVKTRHLRGSGAFT